MIVFVSYSSTNREAVEALVLQLGELGHDVEYEVKFVGGPITWRHIFDSITLCDLFVTAVTRESLISSTCDIEYQYARSLNKNILALLLEDLGTEGLPDIRVKGLVDYRIPTADAQAALADAIATLPIPLPPPNVVPPSANWVEPLASLRKRIENLPRDAREQRAVGLNIKEFMERRESFEVARSLLELLTVQPALRQTTIGEIAYIRDELSRVRTSTRSARRRRSIVGAIGLSSLVALIAVIFSQLFFRYRADYNVNLSMTRTAESIASDVIASEATSGTTVATTPTLVASLQFTATPTVIQPAAAAQVINPTADIGLSTNTPTDTVSTAAPAPTQAVTQVPPTIIILPTMTASPTSFPPTATPVPPTVQEATLQATDVAALDVASLLPHTMYIGITVADTPLGTQVTHVASSAQSAGVQVGDYVLAVDLDNVTTRAQFLDAMQSRYPLSQITLRVRRADGINTITLVLAANDFVTVAGIPG